MPKMLLGMVGRETKVPREKAKARTTVGKTRTNGGFPGPRMPPLMTPGRGRGAVAGEGAGAERAGALWGEFSPPAHQFPHHYPMHSHLHEYPLDYPLHPKLLCHCPMHPNQISFLQISTHASPICVIGIPEVCHCPMSLLCQHKKKLSMVHPILGLKIPCELSLPKTNGTIFALMAKRWLSLVSVGPVTTQVSRIQMTPQWIPKTHRRRVARYPRSKSGPFHFHLEERVFGGLVQNPWRWICFPVRGRSAAHLNKGDTRW